MTYDPKQATALLKRRVLSVQDYLCHLDVRFRADAAMPMTELVKA